MANSPALTVRQAARALSFLLAATTTACIDTELDEPAPILCPAPSDSPGNVVFISAYLGSLGWVRCSGILITRTLVATALGCTMAPGEIADLYGRDEPPGLEPTSDIYFSGAVDPADCSAGTAVEDGSFATLFGPPLPKEAFQVYLPGESILDYGRDVSEVLRTGVTRCSPGIALLRLDSGAGPSAIPVRVEGTASADESLLLSYLSVRDATLERKDLMLIPAGASQASAPGSLEFSETCPEQAGGGLFSATSGALVGILAESHGSDSCRTPAVGTAVPVSAFRRMLLEAAAPDELELESGPPLPNASVCAAP